MENLNNLKIVFMGTPDFAAGVLKKLIENKYNLISVYTQADKKVGRKQIPQKSAIKELAEQNGIKFFEPKKFSEDVVLKLKNQKPDLIIVSAYGKILPKKVLEIPKYGIINTHPSLLPKYRGASPIQNALLNGEKETAATIILISEKVDAGPILSQEKIKISENENYPELSRRLSEISGNLLLKTIPLWTEGKIIPVKQDEKEATFCQMIKKEDGKINWLDEAKNIFNRYRAFQPWPGIFTYFEKGGSVFRLKLNKISLDEKNQGNYDFEAGQVFEDDSKIKVKASGGNIILEEIQLEGKNNSSVQEFIKGRRALIGSVLK